MTNPNRSKIGEVNSLISDVLEIASIKGLRYTKNKIRKIKNADVDIYIAKEIIKTVLSVYEMTEKTFYASYSKEPSRKDARATAAFLIKKHTTMYQKDIALELRVSDDTCSKYLIYINKLGNLTFEEEIKAKITVIENSIKKNKDEQNY